MNSLDMTRQTPTRLQCAVRHCNQLAAVECKLCRQRVCARHSWECFHCPVRTCEACADKHLRWCIGDGQFWIEQVRDWATSWSARGGRGALLAPDEQIAAADQNLLEETDCQSTIGDLTCRIREEEEAEEKTFWQRCDICQCPARVPYAQCNFCNDQPSYHHGRCCWENPGRNRDQVTMPQPKWRKGADEGSTAKGSVGNYWNRQKGGDKGKGKGKQSKDASGIETCYSWRFRQGSCKGDNACPNNRAHCCQWCLSTQHRTMDCPQHR